MVSRLLLGPRSQVASVRAFVSRTGRRHPIPRLTNSLHNMRQTGRLAQFWPGGLPSAPRRGGLEDGFEA